MSDLSWLNPTPHAIAVYASQPLSPVATQHSLPSGRYSLTWAGLPPAGSHQLCLAHLLDDLVGSASGAAQATASCCCQKPSGLNHLKCGVDPLKLHASGRGCKAPIRPGTTAI